MSIPRRLGRLASGFLSNLQEDERVRERLRTGRERGETLRSAFEAALRGAQEELRRNEERRRTEDDRSSETPGSERRRSSQGFRERASNWTSSPSFAPLKYPPSVLSAYERLGLMPGAPMGEVDRKRRELVKKFHPDRFSDPEKRVRAERVTAEINAAHDAIERHAKK